MWGRESEESMVLEERTLELSVGRLFQVTQNLHNRGCLFCDLKIKSCPYVMSNVLLLLRRKLFCVECLKVSCFYISICLKFTFDQEVTMAVSLCFGEEKVEDAYRAHMGGHTES